MSQGPDFIDDLIATKRKSSLTSIRNKFEKPELRLDEISSSGELTLKFTQNMRFPDDFLEKINAKNISEQSPQRLLNNATNWNINDHISI